MHTQGRDGNEYGCVFSGRRIPPLFNTPTSPLFSDKLQGCCSICFRMFELGARVPQGLCLKSLIEKIRSVALKLNYPYFLYPDLRVYGQDVTVDVNVFSDWLEAIRSTQL